MNLNQILVQTTSSQFPSIGCNGYGGEQDGSVTVLGTFQIGSREKAAAIELPNFVQLNWAEYNAFHGWRGVVGYWSDQPLTQEDKGLLEAAPIDWI